MKISVVGAGLAGCECAWQAANLGLDVELFEMKPEKFTPAHHSPDFAELVCSNSLRADRVENAVGLLKEEMRRLDSVIIRSADETRVPAGGALAVDREAFSRLITEKIRSHPRITVIAREVDTIPDDGYCVIATGPLTSESLSKEIQKYCGEEYLHFFDAAAPIVEFDSINMDKAYFAARYGRGGADYINCPMDQAEYEAFYRALLDAETAELKEFDQKELKVFEGCMPVEVMAQRGRDTLRFGPLKPVGLADPKTGRTPYAVVQLRRDNAAGSLYTLVGFQTHLKFPEQKRVFSMIPGLEEARFVRYGVMHRNTFLDSPRLLDCCYRLKSEPSVFFAGQMTGVEGYVESASSGLVAGVNCART
ncbi:MAG TPA: methylenetetrahydrofolate--tRNA-(uracil(54)-C(5))-methyltransferase (FADH(2)-oxidizing) TrmFO, partial [Clostridia bacterium]|nr:methylenetetrahydrofolate--tRNA-(uracil(54)-C(5))-methyltransferase (FADH(2)-oxidizing) TrmFO [Clostridia bacterium]